MTSKAALHKRLTTRVLFFLTLAMVPLGVIGVLQNMRLASEVEQRQELSLLALTERAASGERQIIQRAFGAAQSLGSHTEDLRDNPALCRDYVGRVKEANERYVFIGFIGTDGISSCSTADRVLDFSDYPSFADLIANPRPSVEVNLNAPGSRQSVMIINHPVYAGDTFAGYMSVSLPLGKVGETTDFPGEVNPSALVTFNTKGQLLSTEQGRARAEALLPRDAALAALASGGARTFTAVNDAGENMIYTIVPIVPEVVYALGVWRRNAEVTGSRISPFTTAALPFLMWLASLLVVWFVIDRLVIQRIQRLNQTIRRFSEDRTVSAEPPNEQATTELAEMETATYRMSMAILQDEARLEDQLREKSVLLKEVHHRVKNNLQIISSIMNMQIRKAHAAETKRALGQVQDRILGLSGVHRTLYQAENLTQVNAANLIEQIVEQSRAIGSTSARDLSVKLDLEPVIVYPDQAVPLSMFVSEALTNAMKYIGGDAQFLEVSLGLIEEKKAHLRIENSRAPSGPDPEGADADLSTGLGQQLIRAFATQLNGDMDVTETETTYSLFLTFEVEEFKEAPLDY